MQIYNGTYCVYIHTNKIDGKRYVGLTSCGNNPNKRWQNGKGYKGCSHFYNAILKYGWDNFEHEIIASNLTLSEANHFEELLIRILGTTDSNKGYNLKFGGESNIHSEETRRKMSESQKGKKMSEESRKKLSEHSKSGTLEVREKISKSCTGRKMSDETKRKIGEAAKGRNVGRKHTEEELEKMRKNHKNNQQSGKTRHSYNRRKPCSEERKKKLQDMAVKKSVVQLDLNGNVIKCYDSLMNASRVTGINVGGISACCNGHAKTAGGFIWQFG